ncbi:MAG: hypothetical protein ACM3ML_21290 [Micromonosporaceae bacterium]
MPTQSRPLDAVVGGVVATLQDGVEFREVLGRRVEGSFYTTADGQHWIAVHESVVADEVVRTPSVLHWRLLPVAPRRWTRPDGPLLSPELAAEVEHALMLFAREGDPGYDDLVRAARSALPPIHCFGHILADAWSVLQGDKDAAERFRDAVTALAATASLPADDTLRQLADVVHGEDDERWEELVDEARKAQPGWRAVPMDHEAILLLAAFHAAEGEDPAVGAWYAAVLHDQVCQYDAFATLHRFAVQALAGDEAARKSFWGLLGVLGGSPPAGGLAWPGPPGPPIPHPPAPGPVGPKPPLTFPPVERHPWPPFRGIDPCVLLAVKTLTLSQNRYLVTGVAPERACPGVPITITGSGFGGTPGTVRFRKRGTVKGSPPIDVAPTSWSDTEVVVVVPQDAGWGIELVIPIDEWQVCGSIVALFKKGQFTADFGGGAPDVMLFSVAGVTASEGTPATCTIEPSTLAITWDVRAADHVTVEVRGPGNVVLAVKKPAPSAGSWQFDASTITETTTLQVRLVATGTCEPAVVERLVNVTVQRTPDLTVHGIEVTQAIQYYRAAEHLTDPADRAPDNSARLVANKDAYVRVYLRSGQDPAFDEGELPSIAGTLQVRRVAGGKSTLLTTLPPAPSGSTVTAQADPLYAVERGDVTATLNFVVPAQYMSGRLRLTAEVTSPAAVVGGGPAYGTVDVDVTLRQTLQVAGIVVAYNGPQPVPASPTAPNLVLPAPKWADLQTTVGWTLRTYPVAKVANLRIAGSLTQTASLQDPWTPGSCSVNWDQLMADLHNAADADGNQAGWVYYGLLPSGIPLGPVAGCGGGGVGVGVNGAGETMAEEIGHALGLAHAPCGTPDPDPSYPAYEPYDSPQAPTACIGEYGMDVTTGTVKAPGSPDFMSYCGPPWVSLYHHARLLGVGRLNPVTLSPRGGSDGARYIRDRHGIEPRAVISILGFTGPDDDVDVVSVSRLVTRPEQVGSMSTDMVAELLDADGRLLSAGIVQALRLRRPGQGGCRPGERCRTMLKVYLPDTARGARLRLRRGNQELWSREAPGEPVSVSEVAGRIDDEGRLELRWETTEPRTAIGDTLVRWSSDQGETWRALAVGLKGRTATLDLTNVPGGEILFQVAVNDGFDTATATMGPLAVPHKPPVGAILHPGDGDSLVAGRPLRLWGAAADESGQHLPDEACRWSLDGQPLEAGPDVFVDPPPPGRYDVTLTVQDANGRAQVHRSFTVVEEKDR